MSTAISSSGSTYRNKWQLERNGDAWHVHTQQRACWADTQQPSYPQSIYTAQSLLARIPAGQLAPTWKGLSRPMAICTRRR